MKQRPIVTIAIPAYKRPKGLFACVKSIVDQKEFKTGEFYILVIDDSPEQEGKPVMVKYVKKYSSKIKYICNRKNLGLEKNIMKLIANAKTDYIFMVTDDDKLTKNSLRAVSKIIQKYMPGLIVSAYINSYVNGANKYQSLYGNNHLIGNDDLDSKSEIFSDSHILSGKIFKKDNFDIQGYRRHIGSLYPHMYPIGKSLLESTTYYSSTPLVEHKIGNKVYWNYTDDYMTLGKIKIIEDLAKLNNRFARLARRNLLREFAYILYLNILRPHALYTFLKKTRKVGLLISFSDWLEVFWGGVDIIASKLK